MSHFQAFALALFAAAAASTMGCGAAAEDTSPSLPPTCSVQSEAVREKVCPNQPVMINCTDPSSTNPIPGRCDGPDYTQGHQVTGNGWCCQADPAQESICLSHSERELSEGLTCGANAPDCGFNAVHEPVAIAPTAQVSTVCHCIGGQYACFGALPSNQR